MQNKRKVGGKYEAMAAEYLIENGYEILEMNFRCHYGEVDIIAKEKVYDSLEKKVLDTICFVEVKYRSSSQYGLGVQAVGYRKQATIEKVALYYLMSHGYSEWTPSRFDVISIDNTDISLFRNAFLRKS